MLINGNYGMLVIAFSNLIDNACKFSKDVVNINVSIDDRFINVSISDKGMGIPQDELDNVYQPFKEASNRKVHRRVWNWSFFSGKNIGTSSNEIKDL
ncbi:MAG: ATP-binding protein [Ignavibacteriales bacterium]|nr:ATP-binding protein [Ignavibacteriales bacterium]